MNPYLEPNPTEWLTLAEDEVDVDRWLDCPHYDQCLDYAAIRAWGGFCCIECPIFATQDFR